MNHPSIPFITESEKGSLDACNSRHDVEAAVKMLIIIIDICLGGVAIHK